MYSPNRGRGITYVFSEIYLVVVDILVMIIDAREDYWMNSSVESWEEYFH